MPRQERARPAIAALLALAVLTSGCLSLSTDDEADPEPQTIDPRDGPSSPDAGNDTDEEVEAGTNDTGQAPGPRTVRHAMGETTIEGATERVVALEYNHVENLLALDVQPVGVADKDGYEKWVGAGELDDSVQDVGTRAEPSLETIADLEPDLILAIEFRHEEIYDELSSIAPTLVFEGFPSEDGTDHYERMIDVFERTAKATAHEDAAGSVLQDLRSHYDEVQDRLEAQDQTGREVLLSQVFTYNGQPLARVFLDTSIVANVAERIGLDNAWTKTKCSTGYGYCDVNKEGFADVDHADFFYQAQPDDDPVQDEWSDDPVWNSYEFVTEDRVYPLGADAWMFGGPLTSQQLADRVAEHLVG
jgi:iron complex transport system substrate-binding protein